MGTRVFPRNAWNSHYCSFCSRAMEKYCLPLLEEKIYVYLCVILRRRVSRTCTPDLFPLRTRNPFLLTVRTNVRQLPSRWFANRKHAAKGRAITEGRIARLSRELAATEEYRGWFSRANMFARLRSFGTLIEAKERRATTGTTTTTHPITLPFFRVLPFRSRATVAILFEKSKTKESLFRGYATVLVRKLFHGTTFQVRSLLSVCISHFYLPCFIASWSRSLRVGRPCTAADISLNRLSN